MKFTYDYIVLTAIPRFFFGMIVGSLITVGALITSSTVTRWLRKHGMERLVDEEEADRCEQKEVQV